MGGKIMVKQVKRNQEPMPKASLVIAYSGSLISVIMADAGRVKEICFVPYFSPTFMYSVISKSN
jgi:hypothetical protein